MIILPKYKWKNRRSDLETVAAKDSILTFKRVDCKENFNEEFDDDLSISFMNTYKFCDGDINKFCLRLRKGVYTERYVNNWQRFSEATLPDKKEIYSNLTTEDVTDAAYKHAKESGRILKTKTAFCQQYD